MLEIGAAGDSWQLTGKSAALNPGHTIKNEYTVNNSVAFSSDPVNGMQVRMYNATINAGGGTGLW
jgi:hypothetical protein